MAAQPEELQPIAVAYNPCTSGYVPPGSGSGGVDGVAHELRTPITLISGHAQGLLRRAPQPPALLLIHEEAQRMGTLVTDLLDLARNDSGRLHLRCCPLMADDVLLELYERMAPQAAHRLQLCLSSLVDNALLYGHGPVAFAASTGPACELMLHVRDRGLGVLLAEREAIFGRFLRSSGLSVVRLLIEAMGGRVQVADHPGGGADVQLLLPGGG